MDRGDHERHLDRRISNLTIIGSRCGLPMKTVGTPRGRNVQLIGTVVIIRHSLPGQNFDTIRAIDTSAPTDR